MSIFLYRPYILLTHCAVVICQGITKPLILTHGRGGSSDTPCSSAGVSQIHLEIGKVTQ